LDPGWVKQHRLPRLHRVHLRHLPQENKKMYDIKTNIMGVTPPPPLKKLKITPKLYSDSACFSLSSHLPLFHFSVIPCVISSVCLYVCLYVCLSACLSVCVSICLCLCLSVCISVCLSVCLCIISYLYLSCFPLRDFFNLSFTVEGSTEKV
jgi:hypothetical protein